MTMTDREMGRVAECPKCHADIRPESLFCYNCGGKLEIEDSLAATAVETETADERPTRPAPGSRPHSPAKRRLVVDRRVPREVIWEPMPDGVDRNFVILAIVVFLVSISIAAIAFYMT